MTELPDPFQIDTAPTVPPEVIARKAQAMDFAMGPSSPGVAHLSDSISQGGEPLLREQFAGQQENDLAKARQDIYTQFVSQHQGPVSPNEADFIFNLSKTDLSMDRNTIFERASANRIINHALPDLGDNAPSSPIAEGLKAEPDLTHQLLDHSQDVMTKVQALNQLKDQFKTDQGEQSTLGAVGDFLKGIIPLHDTLDTYASLPSIPSGNPLLPGNALREFAGNYWAPDVSPEDALAKAKAAYSSLGTMQEKANFISALDGMSHDDQDLQNLLSIADFATVGQVAGAIGKTVLKGVSKEALSSSFKIAEMPFKQANQPFKTAVGSFKTANIPFQTAGEAKVATPELIQQMQAVTKELANPASTIGSVIEASGKTEVSAIVDVSQAQALKIAAKDPQQEASAELQELHTTLMNNPFKAITSARLNSGNVSRLQEQMDAVIDNLYGTASRFTTIARLNPEEWQVAVGKTVQNFRDAFPKMSNAVMNWQQVLPEGQITNTGHVLINIGDSSGNNFAKDYQASFNAENYYGLKPGSYQIINEKGGYHIQVERPVQEAFDKDVHSIVLPSDTLPAENYINYWLGYFRPATVHVPEEQIGERNTFVSTEGAMEKAAKQAAVAIAKGGKKVKQLLNDHADKPYIKANGKPGRGVYATTQAELEQEWQAAFNSYPDAKQSLAYFTALKFHDFNHYMQNLQFFRDVSITGSENITVHLPQGASGKFLGKIVPKLPDGGGYNIAVVSPTGGSAELGMIGDVLKSPTVRQTLEQEIANGQMQVVHVFDREQKLFKNELKSISKVKGSLNTPVDFIVTKNAVQEPIKGPLLPFEPLQAAENTRAHVSQPIVEPLGKTGKLRLAGTRQIFGFSTEAQAMKFGPLVEQARKLLKDPSFDSYIQQHLAFWTPSELRAKFARREIDPNIPIGWLNKGEDIKRDGGFERRTGWDRSNIVNLDDGQYSLSRQTNPSLLEKYRGQYSDSTDTIRESGPLLTVDSSDRIDLMRSLHRDSQQSIRSRVAEDYKIKAQEAFVSLFASVLKASPEALRRNPGYYLSQAIENKGMFVEQNASNTYKIQAAKNYVMAVKHLLGMPTQEQRVLDWMNNKLLNSVYTHLGETAADYTNSHLLPFINDPLKFARAVSFHSVLGMFNPWQLFQQGQTMFSAAAIAGPKMALKGVPAGFLLRRILINPRPAIVDHMAGLAARFGWTKQEFKEMFEALQRSGFANTGGETIWKDDASPRLFSRLYQDKIVNWSSFFFNEGNKAPRLAGWAMAYKEWREANPFALLNRQSEHDIFARADLLNINQMRDSASRLQKGILNIPFYFHGYASRLMDVMLGDRLSVAEKARLFGTNAVLYGVPIAIGGSIGIPFYNFIKDAIIKNGGDPQGDVATEAFTNGLVETMIHAVTGKETSGPTVYGSDGLRIISDALGQDKTFLEIALGAPGSIMQRVVDNATPFWYSLTAPLRGDSLDTSVLLSTVNDAAQSIASLSKAEKAWAMYNLKAYVDKRGDTVTSTDSTDALLEAAFGISPMAVGDTYLKLALLKDDKQAKDKIGSFIIQTYHDAFQHLDDEDRFKQDMRRITMFVHAGNLTMQDKINYYQKFLANGGLSLAEKVDPKVQKWLETPEADF